MGRNKPLFSRQKSHVILSVRINIEETKSMPITKSALKALRQADRRTETNRPIRSRVKTSIDKLNASKTSDALSTAFSAIDKALKRNLMHRNKAARLKSKLSKLISTK